MRILLKSACLALLSAACLWAGDLTITSQVSGKGIKDKDATQVQFYSPSRMRTNHSGSKNDSMVDYGQQAMYTIDHDKKVITRMTFQDLQETMQAMEDQMAGLPEFVTKMMFGDISDVKVEQLGPDTVLGRPCKKVKITIGKLVEELSLDPTLQIPIKDYGKALVMLNRMPGQAGVLFKRLYEESAKLNGVALKTRVTGLMGMDVSTVATDVSIAPIPSSAWVLPPDYAQKDGGKELKDSMKNKH